MLYAFGFERVGVVVGDLYFVNPRAASSQEGAEHGVRLELAAGAAGPDDAASLRAAAPEIVEVTRKLLDKVQAGELGNPPRGEAPAGPSGSVRTGWL
jgi:hypothetical protein